MSRVTTLVRCGDLVRYLNSTLASIERQTLADPEIALVVDETTPGAARPWLAAIARQIGAQIVESASPLPAAVRNAGLRATTAPYAICIDAGDRLAFGFCEAAIRRLDDDPTAAFVTSAVQLVGVAEPTRTIPAQAPGLSDLLGDTDAMTGAVMFRRDAWRLQGGFDETLPSLDDYELWLRILAAGSSGVSIDEPLIRQLRKDSHWYRDFAEDKHMAALAAIVEKHDRLFRDAAADVLYARERALTGIGQRYRELVAMRDEGVAEVNRLKTRAADLRTIPIVHDDHSGEDLRRTTPVDREWGYTRGAPVDRYYIEKFLQSHAADVEGVVLEIQEPDYTRRFGGERVTRSDVLDLDAGNPRATLMTDLRRAANVPDAAYDCIVITQTLHVLDDVVAAIRECHRILRPGGVLLATFPCASRLCLEYGPNGDFWRVTEAGARAWLESCFSPADVEVQRFGNVLATTAFLYGLGACELSAPELDADDPFYPMLIGVRARKSGPPISPQAPSVSATSASHRAGVGAAVLLYHRVVDALSDVHELAVSPAAFRDQMSYIRERCHPMPLDELVARGRSGDVPSRAVAVTFDDGYLDNVTNARPILDALELPAAFFVTTDRLDAEPEFWWDVLAAALLRESSSRPPELSVELPSGNHTVRTASADERTAAHWTLYHAIVHLPAGARDAIVEHVWRWSGLPGGAGAGRMCGTRLKELAADGRYSIGAHSMKHEMLPRQAPLAQQHDVRESRGALEQLLDRRIASFAYPYGAYNAETVEAVRSAGYDIAVTCDEGRVGPASDPLRVPRYMVSHARAARFVEWLESILSPQ
jgi:peptidoglycan/xylan/chitin deacetylase (PgdA/CDA1 family)